jgi:hypothetical protein
MYLSHAMPWKHTRFHKEDSMASRRLFMGSLAAAGVGAAGAASLLDFPASAQDRSTSALILELHRQLKEGIGKIQKGKSDGARQLATILRVYATTVDNPLLRTTLAKANRQRLLTTEMNHAELVRQAEAFGLDPTMLPPHSIDRVGRETALDQLIAEGLSPHMLRVADYTDTVAGKMETLERSGRARPLQIALRRQTVDCGGCSDEESQVANAIQIAQVVCAGSIIFPFLAELCAAASATYMVFLSALAICLFWVEVCNAIYNSGN